jgi:hypothetical protein
MIRILLLSTFIYSWAFTPSPIIQAEVLKKADPASLVVLCNVECWTWTSIDTPSYKSGFRLCINHLLGTWYMENWEQIDDNPRDYWLLDQGSGTPPWDVDPFYLPPAGAEYSCL